jgi:tetratricopeptide (TPR) repeat protein
MRRNSSKALKKPSASAAPNEPDRLSNGPTKARNGSIISSSVSESSKIEKKNSTKKLGWKEDPEVNALLQSGTDLMHQGDYKAAMRSFRKAIRKAPKCSMAYWLLGGVYHTFLHKSRNSIPFFKMAVKLSPRTEVASLGLFNALWATDQIHDALEEIKRFQLLTNWSCQDYITIVDEIKEKWLAPANTKKTTKRAKA